jgi:hypothetical protein
VDVSDLAAFLLDLIARHGSGVFDVAPPQDRETYAGLLAAYADAVGTTPDITWVDEQWLAEHSVRRWTELPQWRIPAGAWAPDATATLVVNSVWRRAGIVRGGRGVWCDVGRGDGQPRRRPAG